MQHNYMELEDLLIRQPAERRHKLVDLLEEFLLDSNPTASRAAWSLLSARPWSLASGFLFDIVQDDAYWLDKIKAWRNTHPDGPAHEPPHDHEKKAS